MTISKALKNLYTAMCGGTATKNTAGDLINEIASKYKGALVINGEFVEGTPNTVTITTPLADIYAAADAGRAVFLEYTNTNVETGAIDTTRLNLSTREKTPTQEDPDTYEYVIKFSMPIISSDAPVVATVVFDNDTVGEFDLVA